MRQYRIQLHKIGHRTPWLPPFVLYVCANDTSADRTNVKRGRRSSQAARSISYRRKIPPLCTTSRLSHTAWEIRVSAAPDFRLHYSLGIGSLTFCWLGQTIWLRTDPSKIPFQTPISLKNRLPSPKVFAELFSKSDRIPFPPPLHKQKTSRTQMDSEGYRVHQSSAPRASSSSRGARASEFLSLKETGR